ncbi:MAG: sugar transferase [bacterium]|nr:sugar transferase [bacterium]
MINTGKKEALILLFGDLILFVVSLWLTLFIRYNEWPDQDIFVSHLKPFLLLFVFWVLVFFISGLYDKQTNAFKQKLPGVIFNAQLVNSIIAVLFFYFIPYFEIAPKVNLFIYLLITIVSISAWRIFLVEYIYLRRSENVLMVGLGKETDEIEVEIRANKKYGLTVFNKVPVLTEAALGDVPKRVFTIITDINKAPSSLIFSNVKFIDLNDLYENIFDKVALSNLSDAWFLKNISNYQKFVYDFLKRAMDIVASLIIGLVSLPLYPLVWLAIKIDDGGPVFIVQDRIGQGNKIMKIIKFRSMTASDSGKWVVKDDNRITRVGKFLRKSRIDELPQLLNILRGDLSLIGPRPDITDLGLKLREEIPYYTMRNLIKPGLSGWAQIHQDLPPQSVEETKERLAYDFYYLKNRSFVLDMQIALKTIKTLLSRAGL